MEKKTKFSTMEKVLLVTLVGSLILSFIQSRLEEQSRKH
jgi:cell division protein FtsL